MGHRAQQQAALEATAQQASQEVYQGAFISVRSDEIVYPNGNHKTWDIVLHPGAVAIIPLTIEGDIVLVEQFRRAIGQITLEIPAGLIDPGETLEICAQRELQEEVGLKAGKLTRLGLYYPSPGMSTEKIHLYLAQQLTESRLIADDTHEIDIRIVSVQQALEWIEKGTICDAKTVLAILRINPSCFAS